MRVRVRFEKTGSTRFLGHLDVMRYFQKAFRRAELPIAFSEGYHPHPLLSFAQPLSLSFTGNGEYFDMELREYVDAENIYKRLNAVMCEDLNVNRVTVLPDYKPNEKKITGMALITGAAYAISLQKMPENLSDKLRGFFSEKVYMTEKTTKNGTRECNLREGVHGILLYEKGTLTGIGDDGTFLFPAEDILKSLSGAILYDDTAIIAFLDAGSEKNIPADLFLSGVLSYAGIPFDAKARTVHRMDLFGDGKEKKVPLWMIES